MSESKNVVLAKVRSLFLKFRLFRCLAISWLKNYKQYRQQARAQFTSNVPSIYLSHQLQELIFKWIKYEIDIFVNPPKASKNASNVEKVNAKQTVHL